MMKMSNVNREIEKMLKSAVVVLSSKYNFDGDEGYRMICECSGIEVKSNKRSSSKGSKKVVKSAFPLPYNGELNGECCFGLRQNSGLYTQCPSARPEDAAYCGLCNKQATKNEHGLPDYGSIQTRSSKYLKDEEFVDPSGKKPVAYTKIMKKLKLTEEQVREEAAKHNMTLDPRHFVEVEKKSGRPAKEPKEPLAEQKLKTKGRPKKSKKVLELAGEEEDLFASLVMSASKNIEEDIIEETVTTEVISVAESESEGDDNSSLGDVDVIVEAKPSKASKSSKASSSASPEEKEALANLKKEALAFKKAEEKLVAEQKKQILAEQKKAEAEQKKLALAEQKKVEAEQKKQEAELKKLALAEQKKQEAEQKKLALAEQKKAVTEKKAPEKKVKKTKETKVDDDDRPSPAFVDPPADVVKKIMFEGKKYLKSNNTGIIYNMEQDVIGKWNETKNRIDFDVEGEESEEDYDEDM
jgi:hypothetical protein